MSKFKQSEVSKVCANILSKFSDHCDRKEIVKKFVLAGIPTSTAYRQYAKLLLGKVQRKPGSGLSRNKLTKSNERKIIRMVENKVFCGYRAVGRAIGVDGKTAKAYMDKIGIKVRKRKKAPKVSADQRR